MTAGGGAHHADFLRIDAPLGGLGAGGADGAAGVEERHGKLIAELGISADPVFHHDPGDAALGQPLGVVVTFMVRREDAVAAAGKDHHGRAGGLCLVGQIDLILRDLDVGEATAFVDFSVRRAGLGTGSFAGPEIDPLGGGERGERENIRAVRCMGDGFVIFWL